MPRGTGKFKIAVPGMGRAHPRGFVPVHSSIASSKRLTSASWSDQGKQGPTVAERVGAPSTRRQR